MLQASNYLFSKTKILCTLGPASFSKDVLKKMIEAGMDGVRLNFSHGNYDFFLNVFNTIKEACAEDNNALAILVDLQGPKIRIGELAEPEVTLVNGEEIEITREDIRGNAKRVSTSYKPLPEDARVGDTILIDDGLLRLTVTSKTNDSVFCRIENGGTLKPKKGMNLPGMNLSTPSITEKDYRDLEFLANNFHVDYIALSFVRKAADIQELKDWLTERKINSKIIAKIEKKEAVDNFEEILEISDGIMVARGDLGVEIPPFEVPNYQKMIIRKCNEAGKLVITATQMLESMVNNPVPTRAEASDVANAVWDGTDVVMLSAETSVGKYPVKAVEMMNQIVKNAASLSDVRREIEYKVPEMFKEKIFDSVNKSVVQLSKEVNASAIVIFTLKGRTAVSISKYRPNAMIIALSPFIETINELCLRWGVTSIYSNLDTNENEFIEKATVQILEGGLVKKGDVVIFTSGTLDSDNSRTNILRINIIQ